MHAVAGCNDERRETGQEPTVYVPLAQIPDRTTALNSRVGQMMFVVNWPASCSTSGPASNNGSASMMVPKYEKSTDCVPETRADKYI